MTPSPTILPHRTIRTLALAALLCGALLCAPEALAQKKVAVLIAGNDEAATLADLANMGGALEGVGFTTSRITNKSHSVSQAKAALRKIATSLGPKDKLMVYVASHGNFTEITWSASDGRQPDKDHKKPDSKDDEYWNFNPRKDADSLASLLAAATAGHINLVIDSCRSGGIIDFIPAAFAGKTGVTVSVFASAQKDKKCQASQGGLFGYNAGSVYTKGFVSTLQSLELDKIQDGKISIAEFEAGMAPAHKGAQAASTVAAFNADIDDPDPPSATFTY